MIDIFKSFVGLKVKFEFHLSEAGFNKGHFWKINTGKDTPSFVTCQIVSGTTGTIITTFIFII